MSAISDRWIGVPVAFGLAVLAALVVALLALDAAVELELLELPHPAAISAATPNVSDNDKPFSLMCPLLVCIDLSSESSARKATTVSGSLMLSLHQQAVGLRLPERAGLVFSPGGRAILLILREPDTFCPCRHSGTLGTE
jgi:hypothetical protein